MDHNWSQNIDFSPATFKRPSSIAELQRTVADAANVRTVGAGHSFNDIVATDGTIISLADLPRRFSVADDRTSVTVDGGIRYGELGPLLDEEGLALPNMASLPFFTVAGACATATHGSGDGNQGLAAAIRGLELVTASGDLISRNSQDHPDDMAAMSIGLGAFGVITAITLAVDPRFDMAQAVDVDVPLAATIDRLDEIMASAYSVSLFTDWRDDTIAHVWRKYRLGDGADPDRHDLNLGGTAVTSQITDYHTNQVMEPGPWHERLPHVLMSRPDRPAVQLQSEYFVARRHGQAAIKAMVEHADTMAPAMQTGVLAEVRTVAADNAWMSPFVEDTLAIHISWDADPALVEPVLPVIEEALTPFEPRPHWGKLHSMPADRLRPLYANFDRWSAAVSAIDPDGVFRNRYLDELLGDT